MISVLQELGSTVRAAWAELVSRRRRYWRSMAAMDFFQTANSGLSSAKNSGLMKVTSLPNLSSA